MNENPQYDRQNCYFCHEQDSHILESHHIVPRRHGGSDDAKNLVVVCPNCHERLERLYDSRFYNALDVEATDGDNAGGGEGQEAVVGPDDDAETVLDAIDDVARNYQEGAPVPKVVAYVEFRTEWDREKVVTEIDELKQNGDVYEPETDFLRTA